MSRPPGAAASDSTDDSSGGFGADLGPPLVVVLSGPSGAGKDTILRAALQRDALGENRLAGVVTVKTRPPRPGEREGVHQIFLSDEQFDAQLAAGGFLEHADVYGHRSGVPRDQVRALIDQGKTVCIRTDLQGARTLRERIPQAVLIFVTVPDLPTLEARLRARAADSEADLEIRLAAARAEMEAAPEFDHIIINHEGAEAAAVDELLALLAKERAKPDRPHPSV